MMTRTPEIITYYNVPLVDRLVRQALRSALTMRVMLWLFFGGA